MESLDTFRTVAFAADFASERLPPVTVSGGDFKGRVFRLSLTDGGQPTEAEGVQCRLGWNADPGEALGSYVEAARVDGTDTATWEVEAPSSMLAQPRCKAAWMLYTAGTANVLCTLAFDVAVERPVVDTGSAEGEDLVDRLWTAIDTMEQATDNANAATESAHKAADAAAEAAAMAQMTTNRLTAEAAGELVNVPDAFPGTLLETKVFGRSEQVTTTGKNLLPNANNVVGSPAAAISAVPITLAAGTYTFSFKAAAGSTDVGAGFVLDDASGTGIKVSYTTKHSDGLTASVTFTVSADEASRTAAYSIVWYSGLIGSVIEQFQLELGSTATDYEPYSGGVASPSPEWPQAIDSVSSAEVVTAGGNLWNFETYPLTYNRGVDTNNGNVYTTTSNTWYATEDYVPFGVPVGDTVSVFPRGSANNTSLAFYDAEKAFISGRTMGSPLKVPEGARFVRFDVHKDNKDAFMLVVGDEAIAYAEGRLTAHPLDLQGHELRSLPDGTRDELVVNADGSYGIVQRVGRTTVSAAAYFDGQTAEYVEFVAPAYNASSDVVGARSTHAANDNDNRITSAYGVLYWRIPIAQATAHGLTTLDSVNAWLVSNPMTVDYALATETYIPLGTLDPAPSWPDEGVNNAWTVSDLATETGVGYVQSVQIVHDRQEARLAALETAIATMEA